ncbi:MAG TPA: putative metal-dependent hydrolase [Terriglobales bacterium]|nr:putative metal-dependent hydrolase [Terriglobales bacterium]
MDLRYPIGPFKFEGEPSQQQLRQFISDIEHTPARLRAAVAGLSEPQLETPYRPGGWTVRQVAHHVPDSHMNAYVRMKLALTEDNPTIKPYDEARWAETPEVVRTPIGVSLTMLEALHERWVTLLKALSPADQARPFNHPESGPWTVGKYVALSAWHGKHHVAHITNLRERMRW